MNIDFLKLLIEIREIDESLDELEDAIVGFLNLGETRLFASSEFFF